MEQLSFGVHRLLPPFPVWAVVIAAVAAVLLVRRAHRRAGGRLSRTGERLQFALLALLAVLVVADIRTAFGPYDMPVPLGIGLPYLLNLLLEDVILGSVAYLLVASFFAAPAAVAAGGGAAAPSGAGASRLVWELRCPTCAHVYRIGEDSAIVTPEALHAAAEFSVRIGRRAQPDLVGERTVHAGDRAALEATIRQVQGDLKQGRRRQWWCNRCGNSENPHDYPRPE